LILYEFSTVGEFLDGCEVADSSTILRGRMQFKIVKGCSCTKFLSKILGADYPVKEIGSFMHAEPGPISIHCSEFKDRQTGLKKPIFVIVTQGFWCNDYMQRLYDTLRGVQWRSL
jgi:hypothetical protein